MKKEEWVDSRIKALETLNALEESLKELHQDLATIEKEIYRDK